MSNRITFTRGADGVFALTEARLAPVVEQLFDGNPEPRVPAELVASASRELVNAAHRLAYSRQCDFQKAAGLLVRERPALFKLTRCAAVATGAAADAVIEEAQDR